MNRWEWLGALMLGAMVFWWLWKFTDPSAAN